MKILWDIHNLLTITKHNFGIFFMVCLLSISIFSFTNFKGSSDPSHFIFGINVGKGRIRHRTTLNLNDGIFNRFWVDLEIVVQFKSRCISDPTLSDIDSKNKMAWVWTTLNIFHFYYQTFSDRWISGRRSVNPGLTFHSRYATFQFISNEFKMI